jgi:ABC-type nitrate/sulfonate/bicarbonate transport system ATPase subunit
MRRPDRQAPDRARIWIGTGKTIVFVTHAIDEATANVCAGD